MYELSDLIQRLPCIGVERLSYLLGVRAESDEILRKTLLVSLTFEDLLIDVLKIKKGLDSVLHFSDSALISDFAGHELILDEILWQVDRLAKKGNPEEARMIALYALNKGKKMTEQFEEGFSWNISLEEIEKWLEL